MAPDAIKNDLIKRISETNDASLLDQVKAVLDAHTSDRWNDLPPAVREGVLKGFAQSERGEGEPHEEVMKRLRSWRGK